MPAAVKYGIKTFDNLASFLFLSVILFFFLLENPFSFNYEIETDNSYLLFSVSVFVLTIISLRWLFRRNKERKARVGDLCVFFILLLFCFGIWLNPIFTCNEHIIVIFCISTVYY